MKYGVIDIGSNSVRLMVSDGVKTQYKILKSTRLAEGLGDDKILKPNSIERTLIAIKEFCDKAKDEKVDKLFVFATAAVRQANNKAEFLKLVKDYCGVDIDIVSGEKEAKIGLFGALNGKDGGIVDIGGASTEIAVVDNSKIIYAKSVNIGAVSLTDLCAQNRVLAEEVVRERIKEFSSQLKCEFYSIGGTATTVGAINQELEVYSPDKIDGYILSIKDLEFLTDKLYKTSIKERKNIKGLQPERAKVIANGCLILLEVMRYLKLDTIKISDKDNLEGYLMDKLVLL